MSDLASALALPRVSTHLPLGWYFDPQVAEIEKKLLQEEAQNLQEKWIASLRSKAFIKTF